MLNRPNTIYGFLCNWLLWMSKLYGDTVSLFFDNIFTLFKKVLVGPRSILWGYWYPLFRTSDDSTYEFQSQGGLIVTCSFVTCMQCSPESSLDARTGYRTQSLSPKASMMPLSQPHPANIFYTCLHSLYTSLFKQPSLTLRHQDFTSLLGFISYVMTKASVLCVCQK